MPSRPKQQTEEPLERKLWKTADKLRKNIDAAQYNPVLRGWNSHKFITDGSWKHFGIRGIDSTNEAEAGPVGKGPGRNLNAVCIIDPQSLFRDRPFGKADFVISNPAFKDSGWPGEHLRKDARWINKCKTPPPPVNNANYALDRACSYRERPRRLTLRQVV